MRNVNVLYQGGCFVKNQNSVITRCIFLGGKYRMCGKLREENRRWDIPEGGGRGASVESKECKNARIFNISRKK